MQTKPKVLLHERGINKSNVSSTRQPSYGHSLKKLICNLNIYDNQTGN